MVYRQDVVISTIRTPYKVKLYALPLGRDGVSFRDLHLMFSDPHIFIQTVYRHKDRKTRNVELGFTSEAHREKYLDKIDGLGCKFQVFNTKYARKVRR